MFIDFTREGAVASYEILCNFLDERVNEKPLTLYNNITWFCTERRKVIDSLTEDETKILTSKVKSRLQWEANLAHRLNNRWGLVCMATGTGKSKTAIDAIRSLVGYRPEARVLIVVPTAKLRDKTWRDEFKEWGAEDVWENNVEKICYASLKKKEGCRYDFVVFDEVHNLTVKSADFLLFNQIDHCMALTATPPKNSFKQMLLAKFKLQMVYEITLDQAVDLGVVSPYEITVITTELDKVRRNIEVKTKAKHFFTTEYNNYAYYAKIENSEDSRVKARVGKFFYINRMRFIYNLTSKIEAAEWLLKNIIPLNRRTLIFCGSITHADRLSLHTYHSKSGSEGYDLFVDGTVDRLACVEALNEGDNIPNVDIAFIEQLNSNGLDLIQRIGRILRFRVGHVGRIVILCVKGTVDAKWTIEALAGLDRSKIRWIDYKDIVEGKEVLTF